jgi:tRNA 2-thiouridine synthesizing protein E
MMANSMDEIMNPSAAAAAKDADFPHAPRGWSRAAAEQVASQEGLELSADHWKAVQALQAYFSRHEDGRTVNVRELHDALDEDFHAKGGIKYLYGILPGGPVAQGCRLAGLEAPPGATNASFGSVQ